MARLFVGQFEVANRFLLAFELGIGFGELNRRDVAFSGRLLATFQLPPEHRLKSAPDVDLMLFIGQLLCTIETHRLLGFLSSVVPDRAVHSYGAIKTLRDSPADHALLTPFHVKSPTQLLLTLEVQLVAA
jgi:hypothetical protein